MAPEVIDKTVRKAFARVRPSDSTEEQGQALRAELPKTEELARLTAAIANGG
jgi:hypothetical protein